MFRCIIPIATFSIISGCGGTSTPATVVVPPTEAVLGEQGASTVYSVATDSYVVTRGATRLVTEGLPDFDNGTFEAAKGTTDGEIAMFESRSDNSVVLLLRPNPSTMERPTVTVSRLTDTAIPQTGSAVIEGDYQAIVNSGDLTEFFAFVDGRATINVDFRNQSVSGTITERTARDAADNTVTPAYTFEDLTIQPTTIGPDGAFSGVTAGGEMFARDILASSTSTGDYSGLLAGPTATEAVIAVKILHDFGFGGAGELGAIAAGH